MTTYSMTAFATVRGHGEWGSAVWELRSVNHRYLDASLRLPESCTALEPVLREKLQQTLQRGKVECALRQLTLTESGDFSINEALLHRLHGVTEKLRADFHGEGQVDLVRLLAWPDLLRQPERDWESVHQALLGLFEQALQQLNEARAREGAILAQSILSRLDMIAVKTASAQALAPAVLQEHQEKVRARFTELNLELNTERLEQELVLMAQRMDVTEELERLHAHVHEVRQVLAQAAPVGRTLDFYMQELNREANTLASKSTHAELTRLAVDLKIMIEQIREQVQNLE